MATITELQSTDNGSDSRGYINTNFSNLNSDKAETSAIPSKATGAELDTGTDDAKFATAKALADSKYVKRDETATLTNKTIDADDNTITDIDTGEFKSTIITGLTEKTTPADDDVFLIQDSEASNAFKKVKKSNIGGGGGSSFWTAVAGSPTRTSNTTFTVTDTSNANNYDKLYSRGTCLKWTESSTLKQAMVVSATYATNTVTITIMGDTMASIDSDSLEYFSEKARVYKFAIAGTIGATGTDLANKVMVELPSKIYGADIWAGTAGNGTTTVDINKDGTTMFTTKPSITTTNQNDLANTADNGTTADTGDYLTIDVDAVASTTKIVDLYVNLYYIPNYNSYLE